MVLAFVAYLVAVLHYTAFDADRNGEGEQIR